MKTSSIRSTLYLILGTLYAGATLAAGNHAGGHHDEKPGAGHHGGGHGMAGHHGPGAWNAPAEAMARPNPIPADAASVARGQAIYARNCASCHGAEGEGDGPAAPALNPPPANLAFMANMHTDGDLAWKIAQGRGAMPAWKGTLSQREIWDTVNYLKVALAEASGGHGHGEGHGDMHHGAPRHHESSSGSMDHGTMDHGTMDHASMGHAGHAMGATVTTGPWSYHDRKNPAPHRRNRWEMVPAAGSPMMYVRAEGAERCAALLGNPRIMVDRETRAACGGAPAVTAPPVAPGAHQHHH